MSMTWTIQRVAAETGLSADTLRYYERIGLLPGIARSESGHRRFSEGDIGWIRFLQCLRSTGMPIESIHRYAELMRAGDHTSAERLELLKRHRLQIRADIAELTKALGAIETKIAGYETLKPAADLRAERSPRRKVHLAQAAG